MGPKFLAVLGLFAAIQVACVPDPVMPTMSEDSRIPAITAERLQACMTEYAEPLNGQSYGVQATVKVDLDGRVVDVIVEGMPAKTPALSACVRVALKDMSVPMWVFRDRSTESLVSQKQSPAARGVMGNVLVVGGAIALGEIIAKAFGATLIFAVAVELVVDTVKETTRPKTDAENTCNVKRDECLLTELADILHEDLFGTSRCEYCRSGCMQQNGDWPSRVKYHGKYVTCEYWKYRPN